jgi:hypothetical protein
MAGPGIPLPKDSHHGPQQHNNRGTANDNPPPPTLEGNSGFVPFCASIASKISRVSEAESGPTVSAENGAAFGDRRSQANLLGLVIVKHTICDSHFSNADFLGSFLARRARARKTAFVTS